MVLIRLYNPSNLENLKIFFFLYKLFCILKNEKPEHPY